MEYTMITELSEASLINRRVTEALGVELIVINRLRDDKTNFTSGKLTTEDCFKKNSELKVIRVFGKSVKHFWKKF